MTPSINPQSTRVQIKQNPCHTSPSEARSSTSNQPTNCQSSMRVPIIMIHLPLADKPIHYLFSP
eukprot:c31571_g1_i1 orf=2-190(-)